MVSDRKEGERGHRAGFVMKANVTEPENVLVLPEFHPVLAACRRRSIPEMRPHKPLRKSSRTLECLMMAIARYPSHLISKIQAGPLGGPIHGLAKTGLKVAR